MPQAAAGGEEAGSAGGGGAAGEGDGNADLDDSGGDVVERIVAATISSGQLMYKVHWLGASDAEDEWFSRTELAEFYPSVVAEFEVRVGCDPASRGPINA